MRVAQRHWDGSDPGALAESLRAQGAPESAAIVESVSAAITAVSEGGDAAAIDLGERFDGVRVERIRVAEERCEQALAELDPELREALELAGANIRAVAEAQLGSGPIRVELEQGQRIELAEVAVGSAAIYAPGGRAAYPSSVLMGVIPALVAGVGRLVVASPPRSDGLPDPTVLAAARLAGAHEVVALGGAQAVAALAYGTESVAAVDLIAGPGSAYVQEAKLQVCARVGIDGYAGPSELVVIADREADPTHVALDLAAQGEHGSDGLLVAITYDAPQARQLVGEVEAVSAERPTVADAHVEVVEAPDLDRAIALAEAIAPEHLELAVAGAEGVAERITTAGCVFCGAAGATAFGDYAAGSNHILPTGGAGRFSGPLGPGTFRRRISRVSIEGESAVRLAPITERLAREEGFPVHGESARARADAVARGRVG